MTRYVTRRIRPVVPRIRCEDDYDDAPEARPTIVVVEPAEDFTDTGLFDASGEPIFRERNPIGFVT